MLIRLTSDQVSNFWEIIKYSFEQAAPPTVLVSPDHATNLLEDLLVGTTDCWISFQRGEKGSKVDGVVITKIVEDDTSKTRNLLIYSLYGYSFVGKDSWIEGLTTIARWAKSKRCYQIIGFTTEDQVVSLVDKMGGDSSVTLVRFDVSKALEVRDIL